MSERLTISDSKRAFHLAFTHVIPPIYRRVSDELLVELHLLTHQKGFKADPLFSIGLCDVFDSFTQGYKPEKHLQPLFEALCKSNGLDPISIRSKSEKLLTAISGCDLEELDLWIKSDEEDSHMKLFEETILYKSKSRNYSRLMAIGLLKVLKSTKNKNLFNYNQKTCEYLELKGLSKVKVEKDLNLYDSNIEKLNQALELFQETINNARKKNEKSVDTDKTEFKDKEAQ